MPEARFMFQTVEGWVKVVKVGKRPFSGYSDLDPANQKKSDPDPR